MPLDGDPEDIENTGISTNTITNYLRSCGADNAVMILDACRSGGKKSGEGVGRQTEAEARQTGVISFFSCSPEQYSYELEAISQGAFTYALIEGLGIRGKCATVERLNQYLEHRAPELVRQQLGKSGKCLIPSWVLGAWRLESDQLYSISWMGARGFAHPTGDSTGDS